MLVLTETLTVNGAPATVPIPSNLAAGNYLLRHEIIALHLGTSLGGAEFYPSCTQITVTGNGNGQASGNELVSFPGAYKDNDKGIFFPDVSYPSLYPNNPLLNNVYPRLLTRMRITLSQVLVLPPS